MADATECFICGTHRANSIETHHIVPRRYGGTDAPENLVNLCSSCHSAIEKIYDDSFYDRLGLEKGEINNETDIDISGTTVSPSETKDRDFPRYPAHVVSEEFGLEISFAQFYLHSADELITDQIPESDLLIQKLNDIDIDVLKQRVREWHSLPNRSKALISVYPEDERLTPPVQIVKSDQTTEYDSTHTNAVWTDWFSRFHCGYCHTVYSEFEKADLAGHLRVQHHIEDPYLDETEGKESRR